MGPPEQVNIPPIAPKPDTPAPKSDTNVDVPVWIQGSY